MDIAITNKDMKKLFSLFPTVVEEFRDYSRVYSDDIEQATSDERKSPTFLAKQRYISNMNSIVDMSDDILDSLEQYSGAIDDGSAYLDLIRGIIIYGANRRREIRRAIKTANDESFIVNNNHITNIYGSSFFDKPKETNTDEVEDLTYIFDSTIGWKELDSQLIISIAQGAKTLERMVEDGKKIDEMKSVPPELYSSTQDIRSIANMFYRTCNWVRTFAKKHKDTKDNYEIYQYFFLFYASFVRKFYANHWRYRVDNHEALNIHNKLVAGLK